MAVVRVGAFDLKKCGCCFSGVLWKARTESCDVLVTDCLMVAGMAKGRRKRNAMVVVVMCEGGRSAAEVRGYLMMTSRIVESARNCQSFLTPRARTDESPAPSISARLVHCINDSKISRTVRDGTHSF